MSSVATAMTRRVPWRALAALAAAIPLAVMLVDGLREGLTVNPIQELTLRTGKVGLVLLVAALACTPLNALLGWRFTLSLRRDLGLYGFGYIALHLAIFALVDLGLDLDLIARTVLQKPFVIAGSAAFLLLLPLAITSTRGWQRRLGRRWKGLHRLFYIAMPLAVLHYAWLVKADLRPPLAYAVGVAVLLLLRVSAVRRLFGPRRRGVDYTART